MTTPVGDGSELAAYAWLSRACEPGNLLMWAYVLAEGAIEVAEQIRNGSAPHRIQQAAGPRAAEDRCLADLETADRRGIRLVTPADPQWPDQPLQAMSEAAAAGAASCVPPLSLWVRGVADLREMCARAVAVVGARASTPYGDHVAGGLAAGLAEREWCIVSGGAFGIDMAAHKAALAATGSTIAVLACGADRPYPKANAGLLDRIADEGLLISEWPPGAAPMRQRFLVRNRLIAGLSAATVVVEAAVRSGARSTAARCRDLGRPLLVVPGPVTSAMSSGCLALLREGDSTAVGSVGDVVEVIGSLGADAIDVPRGPELPTDHLSEPMRRLLDALPLRRAAGVDSLCSVSGLNASDVIGGLSAMELSGLAECIDGAWRRARR